MTSHPSGPPPAARRRRPRTTSPRVVWADRIARTGITLGGMAVIAAVLGILVYLVAVVQPLFARAAVRHEAAYPLVPPGQELLFAEIDEYRLAGVCALRSGEALLFAARTGEALGTLRIAPQGAEVAAWSSTGERFALGLGDGSLVTGRILFETQFLPAAQREPGIRVEQGAVVEALGAEARRVVPTVILDEPIPAGPAGSPAVRLDYRPGESETRLAVWLADGSLHLRQVVRRRSLRAAAGAAETTITPIALPSASDLGEGPPAYLLLTSRGDQLYAAWEDGHALRFDLRDLSAPELVERFDLTPGSDARLTSLRFSLGEQSLMAGDSSGVVRAWFRVLRPGAGGDGLSMAPAHVFPAMPAAVTALAGSSRDKSFVTAASDGKLSLRHLTSERLLAEVSFQPPAAALAARITPKGDGLFAVAADGRASLWSARAPHPETSWRSLFGTIWYEGYPEPGFTWQSSSGTDDFEPKLSLIPLIFGTLKATLYSMLFAVPIALAAAIYTSEFLDRRSRAAIKPLIEMMASLPSVVLGFLAALVLAPLVESWVAAVLCAFVAAPLAALAGGYVWEALPRRLTLRASGDVRLALIALLVVGTVVAAPAIAAPLERLVFHGDFKSWLSGRTGTGAPGVAALAWPLVLFALLLLRRAMSRPGGGPPPSRAGSWASPARFLVTLAASVALAALIGALAASWGIDPRGTLVGSYAQRNALVVGFVMGFAVIPIIYTIAEDALSSVPQALRSASLGCGATRWQTAVRVVLPVALSGIFSATMVGFGRAVGETMIVLMAAGNTPLMEINIFEGLRTLSANIAVELPEAVKDGTLYRVLFLAALILFMVTFVVNTAAEIVRQRFRRRAFQL